MFRSISIHSNRPLLQIKDNLNNIMNYVDSSSDIEFVLSDNSLDKNKEKFCKKINSKNFNYLLSDAKKSSENSTNAIKNSKGEFILNLGDDDKIIKVGKFQFENIENKDGIGFRPNFAIWSEKYGITGFTNFSIDAETPLGRINEYFQKSKGNNNTLYSFFRRDELLDLSQLMTNYHPFSGVGYNDWAMVIALLASGKLVVDNSTIIIYNNERWTTDEVIKESIESLFLKNGYNKILSNYLLALLGFDSFIFIARKNSKLAKEEKFLVASAILKSYMTGFTEKVKNNITLFKPNELNQISNLFACKSHHDYFNAFFKILELIAPNKIEEYKKLYFYAIGEEI